VDEPGVGGLTGVEVKCGVVRGGGFGMDMWMGLPSPAKRGRVRYLGCLASRVAHQICANRWCLKRAGRGMDNFGYLGITINGCVVEVVL
jgi:hypothetical protein